MVATTQFNLLDSLGIPEEILTNKAKFIGSVRKGISGNIVRQTIKILDNRDVMIRILGTTSGNLSRTVRRKQMSPEISEEVLDTIRLYAQAMNAFDGDIDQVKEWMRTPVTALAGEKPHDLFDTFEGREWIASVLRKIEYGEFV